jgi:Na+/phosphate symporter
MMPRHSNEYSTFNKAMDTILRADPKAVKEAMETEKKTNAEKRKTKKSSASGHASGDKD